MKLGAVGQHLQEIGRCWPGATKMSEILVRLIEDHLTPLLECKKIHSSNEANFLGAEKGGGSTFCDPSTPSRMAGQIPGRTTTRKSRCAILSIPKASSSISVTDDSTARTFMRRSHSPRLLRSLTSSGTSNPSGFVNASPGNNIISDPSSDIYSKFDSILPSYDWFNFHHHRVPDITGLSSSLQPVGPSNSLEQP